MAVLVKFIAWCKSVANEKWKAVVYGSWLSRREENTVIREVKKKSSASDPETWREAIPVDSKAKARYKQFRRIGWNSADGTKFVGTRFARYLDHEREKVKSALLFVTFFPPSLSRAPVVFRLVSSPRKPRLVRIPRVEIQKVSCNLDQTRTSESGETPDKTAGIFARGFGRCTKCLAGKRDEPWSSWPLVTRAFHFECRFNLITKERETQNNATIRRRTWPCCRGRRTMVRGNGRY